MDMRANRQGSGGSMNKSELIKTLAEQSSLSLDEATMVVNTFVDSHEKGVTRWRSCGNSRLWKL